MLLGISGWVSTTNIFNCFKYCFVDGAAAGGVHGHSRGAVLVCNPDCHDLVAQQDSSHPLPHLLCLCVCLER